MSKVMRSVAVLSLVVLVTLSLGCVSNKKFQSTVDGQSSRIDEVQSGVEANERRVGDLRTEVDGKISAVRARADEAMAASGDAMDAARAADRKAAGKVLWEVTLTADDILFDVDEATITAGGKAALDNLVGKVKNYEKAAYMEVEGHTDATGSESYNMSLGLSRAEAVRSYLNQQGIPLHMISVISYGETKPIADNSTKEGRAANRRVVARVLE